MLVVEALEVIDVDDRQRVGARERIELDVERAPPGELREIVDVAATPGRHEHRPEEHARAAEQRDRRRESGPHPAGHHACEQHAGQRRPDDVSVPTGSVPAGDQRDADANEARPGQAQPRARLDGRPESEQRSGERLRMRETQQRGERPQERGECERAQSVDRTRASLRQPAPESERQGETERECWQAGPLQRKGANEKRQPHAREREPSERQAQLVEAEGERRRDEGREHREDAQDVDEALGSGIRCEPAERSLAWPQEGDREKGRSEEECAAGQGGQEAS